MIRVLTVLFFIVSFSSQACMFPIQGAEYDALINIERLEESSYRVTVPRVVHERTDPIIVLGFDIDDSDEFLFAEEIVSLKVEHKKDISVAYFSLEKQIEETPFINVRWPVDCCLCEVIANTLIPKNEG
ncbi:hypothetical protein [Agaribacter marinus]|uniref:Lipoprotein n=1 Tax=Agaribacter marinus TaxID=1431249 RepID=A0AA37WH66_9ALTE|nr:hypothetical protein [Agaribacter marinus]GLR69572.1 hypothetical protein GCM10007852_04800 [Agaribacter marinus]